MPQTSFTERLERIERAQGRPITERILIGLSEEQEAESKGKGKSKANKIRHSHPGRAGLPLRFIAGFTLMFTTFYMMSQMTLIDAWLIGMEAVAPYIEMVRIAVGIGVVAVMLFFAFKLHRAAFRILSEPARLPFAIGMVAGLALGAGPSEFTDTMMAQLNLEQR